MVKRQVKKQVTPTVAAVLAQPSENHPPVNWKWIIGLILLAFSIRIPFLGRSDLWVDELLFMWDSQLPMSPWQVWTHHYQKFPAIGHLPLGAMFHNAFLHMTGRPAEELLQNPFLQRIPALIWGTLSVPMLYLSLRRLAGETMGRYAGVLLAVSFYPVFYSREAYYYAPLMFFTVCSLYTFSTLVPSSSKPMRYVAWLVTLVAVVLTHISGVMLPLSFMLYGLYRLIYSYLGMPDESSRARHRKHCGIMIGIPLLSTLPLIPFIMIRMAHPGRQSLGGAPEFLVILYDAVGKMFAGISPVASVLSWVMLGSGLWLAVHKKGALRDVVWVVLIMMIAITIGALKTQYSSRYFTVAAPGIFMLFACGFYQLSLFVTRGSTERATRTGWGLVVVYAMIHAVFFHPLGYTLEAKARNYGGMARWLNQNRPAGGAYLIESGYDLRFLGQYHKTPDLTPIVPFYHSNASDVETLRSIHQNIMLKYPDVPFVEASRHGTEYKANVPVWTWPHTYFKQKAEIWNRPLQKLVSRGIWPQIHARGMPDIEYHTTIWYNNLEDIPEVARDQGKKAYVAYGSSWRFAQVGQGFYARVHQPPRAEMYLIGLKPEATSAVLRIQGSVASSENEVVIRVEQGGRVIQTALWSTTRMNQLTVAAVELAGKDAPVTITTDPQKQASIQAIIIDQAELE